MRIGLATAKALGLSRGLPVSGVCTLDALGRGLVERAVSAGTDGGGGASAGGDGSGAVDKIKLLAVTDARRGELFSALYSSAGERLWDPAVSAPNVLGERLGEAGAPLLAAGSGALRFRQELASEGVAVPDDADPVHRVAARHVCALAAARGRGDGGSVAPIYLRPPDAERWRERDTSQAAD